MLFFIYITRSDYLKNYDYYSMYRGVNELSSLNKLFAAFLTEKINIMNYSSNAIIEKNLGTPLLIYCKKRKTIGLSDISLDFVFAVMIKVK